MTTIRVDRSLQSNQESSQTTRSEIELLLCCARTHIDTTIEKRIKILLQQEIDWSYLIQTSAHHGVIPLLYRSLNTTCPEAVPESILSQLRNFFHTNAQHNLFLTQELLKLLNLLTENGIPAIPFKGPILAASAYGNLALRQFGDLDILVREQDIFKAKELLIAQAYRMKIHPIKLTDAQEAVFVRSHSVYRLVRECAYPFVSSQNGIMVELHWAVMPKVFSCQIDCEQLWENLNPVSIIGHKVPNLSPENTLVTLCGHGTKDCWPQLARICDIAELIYRYPKLNWQQVIKEADSLGHKRMLFLGLYLANNLLGTSLPDLVWQKMQTDPLAKMLAVQVQKALFPEIGQPSKVTRITYFHLRVRERLRDKLYCFLHAAMTPSTSDWTLLPLAEFPSFLYYLIRPVRLTKKLIQALLHFR